MSLPGNRTMNEAVVRLGVGKNMVTAINFWLRGFNIFDRDANRTTVLGDFLFGGRDPFLEDTASLWLLHYAIVSSEKVFIFNGFFNEFTKERTDFTKDHLIAYMKRKTEEEEIKLFSDKTYDSDAHVFLRTYVRSNDGRSDLEDETANLLVDLNLITTYTKENTEGKMVQWYRVNRQDRPDLPNRILLFAIIDQARSDTRAISFSDLLESPNGPGSVFRLSEKALDLKLQDLATELGDDVGYTDTAGNRVLQLKRQLNKMEILGGYYGN